MNSKIWQKFYFTKHVAIVFPVGTFHNAKPAGQNNKTFSVKKCMKWIASSYGLEHISLFYRLKIHCVKIFHAELQRCNMRPLENYCQFRRRINKHFVPKRATRLKTHDYKQNWILILQRSCQNRMDNLFIYLICYSFKSWRTFAARIAWQKPSTDL